MRIPLLFLVSVGVVCGQYVEVDHFNYHDLVGIPEAARIKAAEERILELRRIEGRIIGGVTSPPISHPYMAALLISFLEIEGVSYCGSSIVSANRLVTAGHCWADGVRQAKWFDVVFGSDMVWTGGTRVRASSVVTHPQFNPRVSALVNDIAVIHMARNIEFTPLIQPIALPSTLDIKNQFVGALSTAIGYGKISDVDQTSIVTASRREVNLQVMPLSDCQRVYSAAVVLPSNICTSGAGRVGICVGDSGGPLTVIKNGQRVLVGVSSFVAQNQCSAGHPSAYARITSFYSFLIQQLL